jgi:hypothetical protein
MRRQRSQTGGKVNTLTFPQWSGAASQGELSILRSQGELAILPPRNGKGERRGKA